MKITKETVVELYKGISQVKNMDGFSNKFKMAMAKNRKAINPTIRELEKVEPSSLQNEFQRKKVEVAKKYMQMDDNGKPVMDEDENAKFVEDGLEKANEEMKELIEKYNPKVKKVV